MKEEITKFLYQAGANLAANSPRIALGLGLVGLVTAGIAACHATLKLDEVLDEAKEEVERIKKAEKDAADALQKQEEAKAENPDQPVPAIDVPVFSKKEKDRAMMKIWGRTIWNLIKLYGIPFVIALISILLILFGFGRLEKIAAAAASTCVVLSEKFDQYRENVREAVGPEKERDIFYGINHQTVEVMETDEKGKERKTKVDQVTINKDKVASPYSAFFDEYCKNWDKYDPYGNQRFLISCQERLNMIFHQKGYMFLNEARKMIGLEATPEGQIVGWVDNHDDPNCDCCIDLGINNTEDPQVRAFLNGDEKSFLIDFNVDGPIIDNFAKFAK